MPNFASSYQLSHPLSAEDLSLGALLAERAYLSPDRVAFSILDAQLDERLSITYAQLHIEACGIAQRLLAITSGKRCQALISCKSEEAFIASIYGCLYAGVTAVPASLPSARKSRGERLVSILEQSDAAIVVTDDPDVLQDLAQLASASVEGLCWQTLPVAPTFTGGAADGEALPGLVASMDEPAFIQFTSGSTTRSRGAVITHRNIVANMRTMALALRIEPNQISVNWCPLYHDMGLIANVFLAATLGNRNYMIPPLLFLQKPVRWLRAISKYRANISAGPNFAYEECLARVSDDEVRTLDLSSWHLALNGAEPVRAATLQRFAGRFGAVGFSPNAFLPCYGLAENTLWVAGRGVGSGAKVLSINSAALADRRFTVTNANATGCIQLVSCGPVGSGVTVAIVDPDTCHRLEAGSVGEIWIRGASVAQGYWHNPEATSATFSGLLVALGNGESENQGRWLRTGDLGALYQDELYLCGRIKDLMIVRGKNYYAHDIEHLVQEIDDRLVRGGGVAFSVEQDGVETVHLVQEVRREVFRQGIPKDAENRLATAVTTRYGVKIQSFHFVKPGTLPRTTSGKLQRTAVKAAFRQPLLDENVPEIFSVTY